MHIGRYWRKWNLLWDTNRKSWLLRTIFTCTHKSIASFWLRRANFNSTRIWNWTRAISFVVLHRIFNQQSILWTNNEMVINNTKKNSSREKQVQTKPQWTTTTQQQCQRTRSAFILWQHFIFEIFFFLLYFFCNVFCFVCVSQSGQRWCEWAWSSAGCECVRHFSFSIMLNKLERNVEYNCFFWMRKCRKWTYEASPIIKWKC